RRGPGRRTPASPWRAGPARGGGGCLPRGRARALPRDRCGAAAAVPRGRRRAAARGGRDAGEGLPSQAGSVVTSPPVAARGVWRAVVGQPETIAALERAVADPASVTHAWLFTGPPGSGRSVAARAFAGALQCPDGGCGECRECRTALDGTHADVDVLSTEALSIGVAQTRDLVQLAGRSPSIGRYRVILVEDADRLTEQSGNVLLK